MLGLFLLSLTFLSLNHHRPALAAFPFVLSLCFKQMALYYSPAIFVYLLSISIPRLIQPNILLLASLGIVVIVTFILNLLPFALPHMVLDNLVSKNYRVLMNPELWSQWDFNTLQQVFIRVFPFGRGLWEDKVANTWCATNILIKWRSLYSTPTLQKLRFPFPPMGLISSLLCTLLAITPGLVYIAIRPNIKRLPHVFTITALGFFLFSFQVHEKSILLPLLPATLSLFSLDPEDRKWTVWINVIGTIRYIPEVHR
jgi:alpha-1,3-glucosyltransferase